MIRNFRTYDLAVRFYRETKTLQLPRHLKDQFQRAASSIVLNLAEGHGKSSIADQARFFEIAFGSTKECQAILELALDENDQLRTSADQLGASVFCLIRACRRRGG